MEAGALARFSIILTMLGALLLVPQAGSIGAANAAGRETFVQDLQFQPVTAPRAVTIKDAVDVALRNYPTINNKYFKLRAAKANVALAKTQYLPNLNWDIQESGISGNRVSSTVMNNVSGFDTVPVDSGPSSRVLSFKPIVNNLQGLNLNWLMVDFGLRHANDNYAYADARAARADLNLTRLDVAFDAADAYLTAVAAKQVIRSTKAALEHMEAANLRAKTLVAEGLRPGVDAADFDFEVSRARIGLIKAEKDRRLTLVGLAEKMGVAANDLDIISDALVRSPQAAQNFKDPGPFDLTSHPLSLLKTAEINRWRAKRVVLDKAYRPHLWLNSSIWGKGSGDRSNPIAPKAGGLLPQVFDYMVGVSLSFPIMEYFPLKAQKQMARSNELAARADFDLAIQVLEKKDARARIMLAQARKVADETPVLVQAARVREEKVLKRYGAGLTNMVTLAQAEKTLAEAEVEDALAQIEVWHSILSLAYVQGDLKPFMEVLDMVEGSTQGNSFTSNTGSNPGH
ncbi:MAG: TolC family protein [Cyanobacteria bacterium REEB67]|nr:TolC family protein [Cyanobacteria bacterium REEB67]